MITVTLERLLGGLTALVTPKRLLVTAVVAVALVLTLQLVLPSKELGERVGKTGWGVE